MTFWINTFFYVVKKIDSISVLKRQKKKKDNEERVNASPLELCLIPLILPLKLNNISDNFANTLIIEAEAV